MFLNYGEWPRRHWLIGITVAVLFGLTVGAGAGASAQAELKTQQQSTRTDNPKARSIFDEVVKAYKSLASYSDQGEFTVAMKFGGKTEKQTTPLNLTLVRPNKIDFDAGQVRLVGDGKTLTTAIVPFKRYTTVPCPDNIGFDTLRDGQLGAVLFGGPASMPMLVLLSLLTAADPAAAIAADLGGSIQLASASNPAPETRPAAKGGRAAILIERGKGQPGILLTIDPTTKLLSSIELKVNASHLALGLPQGQEASIDWFGWTSRTVNTEVSKDRVFAYTPPKDFAKVENVTDRAQQARDNRLGKPAPNFTLTVLDGPGKTKTVTKSDLAGKLVLMDFWATWCEPCLAELPEIQKVVESYANSKKEVVVVAVSQDDDPSELSELRKRVESTLAGKKLRLSAGSVGLIGLDPSKSVGGAFEIEGYPTLVILDGKGVVRSVHLGYTPDSTTPLHRSLLKEIDALLDGESSSNVRASSKNGLPTD
jgi:thiol-disulfide isomerase/thioredoxin